MNKLNKISIKNIKGVGPKKEQLLNNLNIFSIKDLLEHYPRDYQDLTNVRPLNYKSEHNVLYKLTILTKAQLKRTNSKMNILTLMATDKKDKVELVFFNQKFLQNKFIVGKDYYFLGKVKASRYGFQLQSPEIIGPDQVGSFRPIYQLTSGLNNNEITKFIRLAFNTYKKEIVDFLPKIYIDKYKLLDLRKAIRSIHYPTSEILVKEAKKRLSFNEIFLMLASLKSNYGEPSINKAKKMNIAPYIKILKVFETSLDFELTSAQKRVVKEILTDMTKDLQMNRLVQGDVGSGKTIVSAFAVLLSFLNSFQIAYMAPTEVLARQHYESFLSIFKNFDIEIGLLTGSLKNSQKDHIRSQIQNNDLDLVIGTHSLIQEDVEFKNLGLIITDEQHRFGVKQRKILEQKGYNPHKLYMTATPIPRTLAIVLYGNMNVSAIDELPKNRQKIETIVVNDTYIDRLDKFVLEQINQGFQVYVVCPLIENSDNKTSNLKSLEDTYDHYTSEKFAGINTAYLHGQMKTEEKNTIMEKFLNNDIQILVSTTVIEVGVNVPNATLMIINDADRFGLSQLHQLRGRVGRGANKSYCVLINNSKSEKSYERMQIMKNSNDGFYIAQKDLELRGEGEILGLKQHGVANLKMADLVNDTLLIEKIKNDIDIILEEIDKDPIKSEELSSILYDMTADLSD